MRSIRHLTGPGLAVVAVLLAALLTAPGTSTAATPVAPATPHPIELRVASYNIHAGAGEDGTFDLDRTAAAIRATGAEIVGLQEVDVHWGARSQWRDIATELARRLHMHARFAYIYSLEPPAPGEPRRDYGVAVLSKPPIIAFWNHEITRLSTQDPNPVPEPAPGFAEALVRVRGVPVHVYVTHLDYRPDPSVREMQVDDTLNIMGEDGPHARQLLLGDFNAPPGAPELAPLWTRVTDAYGVAGDPPGYTYPAGAPVKRIDYVTVRHLGVRAATVPDTALARTASDHRPLVADLTVQR